MKNMKMPASHDMHPNVTPLIDIVMCLIIFYMLVAKIGVNTGEDKSITLPPSLLGIELKDLGNTIALNVLKPATGDVPVITTLNPTSGDMERIEVIDLKTGDRPLTHFLKRLKGQNTEFKVIIRADENLDYRYLEPVLICSAEAQVKNVNFATRKHANVVTVKPE
jgi:biopolymer transport protein ExbD